MAECRVQAYMAEEGMHEARKVLKDAAYKASRKRRRAVGLLRWGEGPYTSMRASERVHQNRAAGAGIVAPPIFTRTHTSILEESLTYVQEAREKKIP